ncbi:M20 family metallopeptidase [Alcaligenaceae bacterium]|nr:M20 family metallopeptidase [Alcaligenaceae bacterium]
MTDNTQQITDWLASQHDNMLGLLADLVNIDSNSYDKPGVINVFKRLETFFKPFGLQVAWHEHEGVSNAISVEVASPQASSNKPILLMGHCDTVFPAGEAQNRPFTIKGERAYGPGVADMKAGIAMNAFILAAYAKFGGTHSPLIGLFTNDEEIGSPTSRGVIETFAKKAGTVFNAEPGRPNGDVVTGRKGGIFLELNIYGKAAHSGANFSDGISAINELALKITELNKLTDLEKGVTVNVGLISGGQSVNTTAPHASAGVDLRIFTLDDREKLLEAVSGIVETSYVPGTRSDWKIIGEFSPFVTTPASAQLYALYRDALQTLGHTAGEQFSGGCADSGITSSLGCTTLCATGPVGGKPHTPDEYMEIDTFVPRAQAVAITISNLDS